MFEAIQDFRGSLPVVINEFRRREKQFDAEEWKRKHLSYPERSREGVRQALGFFIGQDPFQPATAGPS